MSLVWSQKFTTKKYIFRKSAVEFKRKYTRFCKYFVTLVSSAKFVGLFYVGVKLEYLNIDTTIFNLILFLDGLKINALYINQVCRLCYFSHLLKMLFLEVCLLIFIETLFFFLFYFQTVLYYSKYFEFITMRNFGAQYLYVQFLTNKHYSGCFAFNVSIGEKEKK